MTVRPAVVADAAAIALVHVRSWQGAYRGLLPADFLARLDPDERRQRWERGLARSAWPGSGTLVAETEDGVVGFAHLRPSPDEDVGTVPTGQLASIYLVPQEIWDGVPLNEVRYRRVVSQ